MPAPLISVIMPLPDHRGQALRSIASFLNQTLDASQVEVVVSCDRNEPKLEAEIERTLPRVRLIRRTGLDIMSLYNEAAAAAHGRYLFITEMHCLAEPDCLEAVLEVARREKLTCACVNSRGINANRLAACEQRILEDDLPQWIHSRKGKVTIRGFLIERLLWQQHGGFDPRFDHFAEIVLGRKLKAAGLQIGFAEAAIVHHVNQTDIRQLSMELMAYGFGECHSCHVEPPLESDQLCYEWRKRQRGAMTSSAVGWRQMAHRLRLHWHRLLMHWAPLTSERYYRSYVKHWNLSIRLGRLQYLASEECKQQADCPVAAARIQSFPRQAA